MSPELDAATRKAYLALLAGDPQAAFLELAPLLEYPSALSGPELAEGLRWFARCAEMIAGSEFAALVRETAERIDDPALLHDLAYALLEVGLSGMATTVITHAARSFPDDLKIIGLTCSIYEQRGLYAEALALYGARDFGAAPVVEGWLAFLELLIGEPERVAERVARLRGVDRADARHTASELSGMLERLAALAPGEAIDNDDLRGWLFVLTGGLLLHLDPAPATLGRFTLVEDNLALRHEVIEALHGALLTLDQVPAQVIALGGDEHRSLAAAIAERLGRPLVERDQVPPDAPGLLVAFDLTRLEPAALARAEVHRPGQALFAFATCFAEPFPIAADFVGFMYQVFAPPELSVDLAIRPDPTLEPFLGRWPRALAAFARSGGRRARMPVGSPVRGRRLSEAELSELFASSEPNEGCA